MPIRTPSSEGNIGYALKPLDVCKAISKMIFAFLSSAGVLALLSSTGLSV
jgi:hypothetical protein